MSDERASYHLFDVHGIELEYMIVDTATLAVRPIADEVLRAPDGEYLCDREEGKVHWSNELAAHVIELKMGEPSPALSEWTGWFNADIRRINEKLAEHSAMLLPGAMHPTMDPTTETSLWRHDNRAIYEKYDRIFNCRRHGWSNLQSCHLNLPFSGDEEFRRLHAAIRVVLPLLPALAASSPMLDGRLTGILDNRLHVYCTHQARIGAAMGRVIPEPIYTEQEYRDQVFAPMFEQIAPLDPEETLRGEFLNARGAIARFERDAIEIRLLDVQETPAADLAICALVTAAVRALVEARWTSVDRIAGADTESLRTQLDRVVLEGDQAIVDAPEVLEAFGVRRSLPALELWRQIAAEIFGSAKSGAPGLAAELTAPLKHVLDHGPLARRLLAALGEQPAQERVSEVYRELAACLAEARMFRAGV